MKEGLRRRMGLVGTVGMAIAIVGCNSPEKSNDSYNFDISFRSQTGQRLDCEIKSFEADPNNEDIIIIRGVNCPDKKKVMEVFEKEQTKFPQLYIDLNTSPSFVIRPKTPGATPITIS